MKFLYDFFPVLLFFITFKSYDDPLEGIIAATVVAIVATILQVGIHWYKHHRFERMHLITLTLIVVFGGATIILQEEIYIKWKPTVVNWLFGIVFLGSQFIGKQSLIQRMMSRSISLPPDVWTRLNLSWVIFFFILGFINLYVVYNYDTDTWVDFKLFGMMGLTLLFVVIQAVFLAKHVQDQGNNGEGTE